MGWVWFKVHRTDSEKALAYRTSAVFFTVGILLPALAYGIFSQQKFGFFSMSSTNGGLSLVEGKCPAKFNTDSKGMR